MTLYIRIKILWSIVAFQALTAGCAGHAYSQDRWINPAGGIFDVGSNWADGSAPNPSGSALFDLAVLSPYSVRWDDFTGNTVNQNLTISGSDVVFRSSSSIGNVFTHSLQGVVFIDGGGSLKLGSSVDSRFNLVSNDFVVSSGLASVEFGSTLTTQQTFVGTGVLAILDVSGQNSAIANSGDALIGVTTQGVVRISDGATFSDDNGVIGENANSQGSVTVAGLNSQWNNSGELIVGRQGIGRLTITNGGLAASQRATIGDELGSSGEVVIAGNGSRWDIAQSLSVGRDGQAELLITSGGVVSNDGGALSGIATVTGGGSKWNNNELQLRNSGSLTVANGGVVTADAFYLLDNSNVFINGSGSQITASEQAVVFSQATLQISSGGRFFLPGIPGSSTPLSIDGSVDVTGNGSRLDVETIFVSKMEARLNISDGAIADSSFVRIDAGRVSVFDPGSQWQVDSIRIGRTPESGILTIVQGGHVISDLALISTLSDSVGVVSVSNAGSTWTNSGDMWIGPVGAATLNVNSQGLVQVGGITRIGDAGVVNLNGGRFEFGETALTDFQRINAIRGSLAGNVLNQEFTDVASIDIPVNANVDMTEVRLINSGRLFGNGDIGISVSNQGTMQVISGERMRFAGNGENLSEINLFGGQMLFDGGLTNEATGFIGGQGQLIADGGINNSGAMAFSGSMQVLGDIELIGDGKIVTTGLGATTSIFDDIVHNGSEIRTSAGNAIVIFGEASGAGNFTGTGTVFFEGDLRPGNSPDVITFEGDVVLATGAKTFIELGGDLLGEFDRLEIDGNLAIDGDLFVDLIGGLLLDFDMEFVIADVGDERFGIFDGLDEGDLIGTFGGKDLFISYIAGTGNDVALFTSSVPEPATAGLCGLFLLVFLVSKRRRRKSLPTHGVVLCADRRL